MPIHAQLKAQMPPNRCRECGEQIRRPKHFCDLSCQKVWESGSGLILDPQGIEYVTTQRRTHGITMQAIEWRNNLNVQRQF